MEDQANCGHLGQINYLEKVEEVRLIYKSVLSYSGQGS